MTRRYIIIVCIVFLLGGAVFIGYSTWSNSPARYFSNALRDAHVDTSVSVQGVRYRVAGGSVSTEGGKVTESEAQSALRLAYAQALARRSPVFDLTGVDLDTLEGAVRRLKASQESLATLQTSSADARSISALYPVRLLQELSSLERTRQTFLVSGADADNDLYVAQARKTVEAGKSDAAAFRAELERALSERSVGIPGLGGTITTSSLLEGAAKIPVRMDEVSSELSRRERCVGGDTDACAPADISAAIPPLESAKQTDPDKAALAKEVHSVLVSASSDVGPSSIIYELSGSDCLAALPGPYYFGANPAPGASAPQVFYLGDLFFQTINARARASAPYFEYLAGDLGITYMRINPLMFYVCPELSRDIGRVRALQEIAQFAKEQPSLAPRERALLVGAELLNERDVLAYLRAALRAAERKKEWGVFDALADLSLMYKDRSAGLEYIVSDIARINEANVKRARKGIPLSVLAKELYLTHSAFPTLFLTVNPSDGSVGVSVRADNQNDPSLVLKTLSTYSALRSTVPRSTFIHDLNALLRSDDAR